MLIPHAAVGVGAGFAFFPFHGTLFPERQVCFAGFAAFACRHSLAVAFLFFGQFSGVVALALGIFHTLADAG
jgi:hypothetical protein